MNKSKKILLWSIVAIAVLAVGFYIVTKIKNTSLTASTEEIILSVDLKDQPAALSRENTEAVVENSGIAKSGFATNSGGVCFLLDDFTIMFQPFSKSTAETLQKPAQIYSRAKILGGENRCIVMLSGAKGIDVFSVDPTGNTAKVEVEASYFGAKNGEYFIIPSEESFAILDSNSNKINDIWNKEKLVLTAAPVSSSEYFVITNYDSEQDFGKLIFRNIGKQDIPLNDVEHVLGLYANGNVAFYIDQTGERTEGWLISKTGQTLARIADIDPESVINYKTGFLFKTKPAGTEGEDNKDSAIGYLEKDGTIRAIIGSEGNFGIGNISAEGEDIFASEGSKVWKVRASI